MNLFMNSSLHFSSCRGLESISTFNSGLLVRGPLAGQKGNCIWLKVNMAYLPPQPCPAAKDGWIFRWICTTELQHFNSVTFYAAERLVARFEICSISICLLWKAKLSQVLIQINGRDENLQVNGNVGKVSDPRSAEMHRLCWGQQPWVRPWPEGPPNPPNHHVWHEFQSAMRPITAPGRTPQTVPTPGCQVFACEDTVLLKALAMHKASVNFEEKCLQHKGIFLLKLHFFNE